MSNKIPEGTLYSILELDKSLDEEKDKKQLYQSYATLYEQELVVNLELTSIELDFKYGTSNPTSWRRFLNHPLVRKFVNGFLEERQAKSAAMALTKAGGKQGDALKVTKMLAEKNNGEDNSRITVVFLPQKEYI